MGLKDAILRTNAKLKPVDLTKWGGPMAYVKSMTARARASIEQMMMTVGRDGQVAVRSDIPPEYKYTVVASTVCDADGKLVFDSLEEVEQIEGNVMDALFAAGSAISGLTEDANVDIDKEVRSSPFAVSSSESQNASGGKAQSSSLVVK